MSGTRIDAHVVAGWVSLPFIFLGTLDGFWKTTLVQQGLLAFWVYDFVKWIFVPSVLMLILHRLAAVSPREYGLSAEFGISDILIV